MKLQYQKLHYNKLLLNWKEPLSRENYLVAVLEREPDEYLFYYNNTIVQEASRKGFSPFIGLGDTNKKYRNDKLFACFECRLPSKNRHDFKIFLQENNLEMSDYAVWLYLCETKGALATDNIFFVSPFVYKGSTLYLDFLIAGWSFTKSNHKAFRSNHELKVQIDESNLKDDKAVELVDITNDNQRVGYIPRPFNALCHYVLKTNRDFKATIFKVSQDEMRPNVLMLCMDVPECMIREKEELQYLIDYQ